jgi:hypothetical protein
MAKKVTDKKAPVKKVAKKEAIKLDPNKVYEFIVTKESKHLKVGSYFIDGVMCETLILKNLGNVKS